MTEQKKNIQDLLNGSMTGAVGKKKQFLTAAVAVTLVGAGLWFWMGKTDAPQYITTEIAQGNLAVTVTANGTLEAQQTVSIGSELSGIVRRVTVDVNDIVKENDVLIELDTAKLKASVSKAEASLASAKASLTEAQAALKEAQTKYQRLLNVRKLSGGKTPAKAEIDEQAATVTRAKATVESARAKIATAQAELETAKTDFGKASISSPIDGVVLSRSVEPGYAVAASLQAVELLTIASDLRKLELEVDVDEADVAVVAPGQKASFTVSAYPNQRFPATLTKVSYGPATQTGTSNVVTYTGYLVVDNEKGLLRPGMTATARIETQKRENVLLVPNTALRFTPTTKAASTSVNALMMRPHSNQAQKTAKDSGGASTQRNSTVWVMDGQDVRSVAIVTGATDGVRTEVISGELKAGDKVVTGQLAAK